jgi:hypothetical protein
MARQNSAEEARDYLMKLAESAFRRDAAKPSKSFFDQLKDQAAQAATSATSDEAPLNAAVTCGPLWATHWGAPGTAPAESDFKFTPKYPAVPNCAWLGMPEPHLHSNARMVEHTIWTPPNSALPPDMIALQNSKKSVSSGWFGFGGRKRNESNR